MLIVCAIGELLKTLGGVIFIVGLIMLLLDYLPFFKVIGLGVLLFTIGYFMTESFWSDIT